MASIMFRLTVYLKDGRTVSGVYDYLSAHARQSYAEEQPNYERSTMEPA